VTLLMDLLRPYAYLSNLQTLVSCPWTTKHSSCSI